MDFVYILHHGNSNENDFAGACNIGDRDIFMVCVSTVSNFLSGSDDKEIL